jgi:hypothetical protein
LLLFPPLVLPATWRIKSMKWFACWRDEMW